MEDRRWTIGAAASLCALENVALLCGLVFAGTAPLFVLFILLLKFPLCVRLLRMYLGAVVTLLLWESFTLCVAVINTSLTVPGQVGLFASATTCSTLLALSLPLYTPTVGSSPREGR
ncbi:MAG: hypothetical protein ACRDY7_09515 [Acidimicrobiia bacterium]